MAAPAVRPRAPRPPRAPGAGGRARPRGHQLLVVLAVDDVLVDRRADDLPARLRLRLRLARLEVNGFDYVEFVGTGTVATAVLFSSVFPSMFGTFVKYQFQHTYDAILAAPVDTEELVTAEALWIAARAGVYGCVPLLVAMRLRLDPRLGDAARAVLRRSSPASAGRASASASPALLKSIDNFNYVTSAVITPLFLVAGTFFPIDQLPEWAQVARRTQPALPLVQLVRARRRSASRAGSTLFHLGVLVAFGLVIWRLAIRWMTKKLVD